ncbi:hypothetical protein Hte_000769 [Hypoxylon texense]
MMNFCSTARKHGFTYAWMDTCCIDKRSSADLSEAINSMYRYYRDAAVCFIYLEDVRRCVETEDSPSAVSVLASRDQLLAAVRTTRWLTRGWTLQELVAPARRCFFTADWTEIEDGADLLDVLAESTGIGRNVLDDRDVLRSINIAERMKWASKRQTTRAEDVAYSLMGLFDVNFPVLYGEGMKNAFKRLQLEIIQSSFDMTIFAWRGEYSSSGLLAQSPADFADTPPLRLWAPWSISPYSMTNVGLSIRLGMVHKELVAGQEVYKPPGSTSGSRMLLAALQCDVETEPGRWQTPMIYLGPVEGAYFFVNGRSCRAYRRIRCKEWDTMTLPTRQLVGSPYDNDVLVLQDEQYELALQAAQQHFSRK